MCSVRERIHVMIKRKTKQSYAERKNLISIAAFNNTVRYKLTDFQASVSVAIR